MKKKELVADSVIGQLTEQSVGKNMVLLDPGDFAVQFSELQKIQVNLES